jgi:hypothetical protein
MKATATLAFPGRRDDESHTTQFKRGDLLDGDLGDVAVREGWAVKGHVELGEAEAAPAPAAKGGKSGKAGKGGKGKPEPEPEPDEVEEELELEDEVDLDGDLGDEEN